MQVNIELEKISKTKKELLLREKMLKNKEKQKRFKKSADIGKLAIKAEIDQLDKEILLGAFLEISKKSTQPDAIESWKNSAASFQKKSESSTNKNATLSVSFKSEINEDTKNKLKDLKFKWNRFRKEFYGYGDKKEIESLLGNQCIVEVID